MTDLHVCPDCRNQFVQPFKCTTCGAQKLYDETVRQQARTIELRTRERDAAQKLAQWECAARHESYAERDRLRAALAEREHTIDLMAANSRLADDLRQELDSQEFYELMQAYRWANHRGQGSPADTVEAFEAVKSWVLGQLRK